MSPMKTSTAASMCRATPSRRTPCPWDGGGVAWITRASITVRDCPRPRRPTGRGQRGRPGIVGGVGLAVRDATVADAATVARIYVDSWNAGLGDILGERRLDAELVRRGVPTLPPPGPPGGGWPSGTGTGSGTRAEGREVSLRHRLGAG